AGYRVIELGGATPIESFLEVVAEAGPVVAVGLSIGTAELADGAAATLAAVRAAHPDVPLLICGPAVRSEQEARALGADAWARDAAATVELVDGLRDGGGPTSRA